MGACGGDGWGEQVGDRDRGGGSNLRNFGGGEL